MNNQSEMDGRKNILKKDALFVCSMLAIYAICFIIFVTVTVFWVREDREIMNANATSTAAVIATQQANVTATAIARLTEQDRFDYIERFDKNSSFWFVGSYDKQYSDTQVTIKDGVYIWDIIDTKTYTQSTEFYKEKFIKDFDVYMDLKFIKSSTLGGTCSGFFFRKQAGDWNNGAYTFTICNDSHFEIQYYKNYNWHPITFSDYEDTIHPTDWNRIEISARGDYFTFTINNLIVFEMKDDRSKQGNLGIEIDIDEDNSAEIWFDNFGFQHR